MSSSKGAARDYVAHDILRSSQRDVMDSRNRFIPRRALLRILSCERVQRLLEIFLDPVPEYTAYIREMATYISPEGDQVCRCQDILCTGRRIIFATLILISKEELIVSLHKSENSKFCDKDLPFEDTESTSTTLGNTPQAFRNLDPIDKQLFRHIQWQMRSPCLRPLEEEGKGTDSDDNTFLAIEDEVTLPWIEYEKKTESKDGEWSYVHRIRIHPDHHALGNDLDDFALKVFEERSIAGLTEKGFRKEIKANTIAPRYHRIVRPLAALKHRRRFYLIFPWAQGGNLQDVWQTHSTSEGGVNGTIFAEWYSTQWLLNECLGIADALAKTHGFTGEDNSGMHAAHKTQLHADIKPENILCFNSDGGGFSLKLSDFGEAMEMKSGSKFKTSKVAHTKTYRPPEHDIEQEASLTYDVWCLGCLYLDFITWAMLGWSEVKTFGDEREKEESDPELIRAKGITTEDTFFKATARRPSFFHSSRIKFGHAEEDDMLSSKLAIRRHSFWVGPSFKIRYVVKSTVTSHIQKLQQHERCEPRLREFLDFIKNDMFVIEDKQRATSDKVRTFLKGLSGGGQMASTQIS